MRSQLRTNFCEYIKFYKKPGKTQFSCVLYWKILSKYTYNIQNTINISTLLWKYFSQFFKTFGEIEIALKKTESKYYRRAFILYHVHWNYIFAMYYYLEGTRKYHDINFYKECTFTGIWSDVAGGSIHSRELQQRRRRRLRKRHLKSVFARVQTSSRLFYLVQFVKCWRICLELDSKGLNQSSGEAKEGRCVVFTPSKNTWD